MGKEFHVLQFSCGYLHCPFSQKLPSLSTFLQKAFTEYLLCAMLCYILEMQTVKETQCLSSTSENSGWCAGVLEEHQLSFSAEFKKAFAEKIMSELWMNSENGAQERAKGTLPRSQYVTFSSSIRLYLAQVRKNWTWGYGCLSWNPMENWTTRPPEDWILASWAQPQKSTNLFFTALELWDLALKSLFLWLSV